MRLGGDVRLGDEGRDCRGGADDRRGSTGGDDGLTGLSERVGLAPGSGASVELCGGCEGRTGLSERVSGEFRTGLSERVGLVSSGGGGGGGAATRPCGWGRTLCVSGCGRMLLRASGGGTLSIGGHSISIGGMLS